MNHCGSHKAFIHGMPHMEKFMHQMQYFMPYDLEETELEYKLTMPLPGFAPDSIDVSISGRTITVEATPPEKSDEPKDAQPSKNFSRDS